MTAGPGPIGSLILAAIIAAVGAVASLVAWWRP